MKDLRSRFGFSISHLLIFFLLPLSGLAQEDSQGDPEIRVIQPKLFVKGLRLEVTPRGGLILNDPFINTSVLGGDLFFHINEWLAVGGFYQKTFTSDSSNTEVLREAPFSVEADRSEINRLMFGELQWSPIYNKGSVMGKKVLHYDIYFSAGAGIVDSQLSYTIPKAATQEDPKEYQAILEEANHLAFNVGVGFRFFVTQWMSVRVDIKDLIYRDGVGGLDEANAPKDLTIHRIPITVGLSFFFPNRE